MADTFSKRYGFKETPNRLVRDEAPKKLREALLAVFERYTNPKYVGRLICRIKHYIPEEHLGDQPRWYVISLMMDQLEWHEVYDLVERQCAQSSNSELEREINELFEEYGIGWKVVDSVVKERGDETHERLVQNGVGALQATGRTTAADEMKAALTALSRRPEPDTRAAVSRAIGAVEALARDLAKDPNKTLGQLANGLGLPAPLDQVVGKLWGYASEQARHVREGQTIELREAYLVVNVCATLVSYLAGC
jgi:hypothetical protein